MAMNLLPLHILLWQNQYAGCEYEKGWGHHGQATGNRGELIARQDDPADSLHSRLISTFAISGVALEWD